MMVTCARMRVKANESVVGLWLSEGLNHVKDHGFGELNLVLSEHFTKHTLPELHIGKVFL